MELSHPSEHTPIRITVVENVYHQSPNGNPTTTSSSYNRFLETDEQPYIRHITVTSEWQPIDLGWLKDVGIGMLIIQNNAKPTPVLSSERRENLTNYLHTIKVSLRDTKAIDMYIYCGESTRFVPANIHHLYIRVTSGKVKATITAIPR